MNKKILKDCSYREVDEEQLKFIQKDRQDSVSHSRETEDEMR